MASYIEFPIETDPDALIQTALDNITDRFPGWSPNEAHLEVALLEELARMASETAQVAADVPAAVFRQFGLDMVGLPAIDGAPPGMLTTWTAINTLGYTIPIGTVFAYRTDVGEYVMFETTADTIITAGETTAVNVPAQGMDNGTTYNGLPVGTTFELVDSLVFVTDIVSTTITSGGVQAEDDDAYRDRLADELTLFSPRPILPRDFRIMARRTEGVHRAVAIDGYNPGDDTFNNERMVALAAVDTAGDAIGATVKTALDADMEARREINFVVNVIDPTYTTIAVDFVAVAIPTAVPSVVEADAIAAVTAYLNPSIWGGGDQSPPMWEQRTTVRYLEIAEVINRVVGVDYIDTLTVNAGTADVVMAGIAPLPRRVESGGSTVIGSVVAP